MPLELKDLAGLSSPMTRLIDAISQGIGRIFKSGFDKKDIDNEAYRISKMVDIFRSNSDIFSKMAYSEGEIIFQPSIESDNADIMLRADSRVNFQEIKRQQNIESIINKSVAAELAEPGNNNINKTIDPDWITCFFKAAEDISNDEMQNLWARILKGESNKPGTFSRRSLEALKNMSKNEAVIFEKIAKLALITGNEGKSAYILCESNLGDSLSTIDSNYREFLILVELGLVFLEQSAIEFYTENKYTLNCMMGGDKFKLVREKNIPTNHYKAIQFTIVGGELALLVTQVKNKIYHQMFMNKMKSIGFEKED